MSFSQDSGGASLAFVTRVVTGHVPYTASIFNKDTLKIERTVKNVDKPVIIFFANGSTIVMAESLAEEKGFLQTPTILNFEAVSDANSVAGRFKFGLTERDRRTAWTQMEQALISQCLTRGGYPLDQRKATFSEKSIFFSERGDEDAAVETSMKEVA